MPGPCLDGIMAQGPGQSLICPVPEPRPMPGPGPRPNAPPSSGPRAQARRGMPGARARAWGPGLAHRAGSRDEPQMGPQLDPKWTPWDPKWTPWDPKWDPKWNPKWDPKWVQKWVQKLTQHGPSQNPAIRTKIQPFLSHSSAIVKNVGFYHQKNPAIPQPFLSDKSSDPDR